MRSAALVLALACAAPAHAAEVFGGYSALRLEGDNTNGASLAVTLPLAGPLRLAGEASGQFGLVQGEDLREWAFFAGPVLAPWREGRVSPFVHAKAGIVRSQRQLEVFGVAIGAAGVCAGDCPSQTGFAAELGGGLDLRLTERFAVRLPQVDLRLTGLEDDDATRLRISAGVVYRWGR